MIFSTPNIFTQNNTAKFKTTKNFGAPVAKKQLTILFALVFVLLVKVNNTWAQESNHPVFSQNNIANFYSAKVADNPYPELAAHFKKYQMVKIPSIAISTTLRENAANNLNIGLQISEYLGFNLQLEKNNIAPANYKLKILTPDGIKTVEGTPNFLYKGKTTQGGAVRLAIKDGFISGSIQDNGKEYFIEPMKHFVESANKDECIVYQPEDLKDSLLPCGYNDAGRTAVNAKTQDNYTTSLPLDNVCKKIKFVMVADYSMYQRFNYDVIAVETELLADLNAAEVFFTGFNFNTAAATDEGTDVIKFEASQIIVSTCKGCDVIDKPYLAGLALNSFVPWIKQNISPDGFQICQYWTTYDLNGNAILGLAGFDGGLGCSAINYQLHHFGGGIPVLRIQIAHETGHNLGCGHDNDGAPVTGFIMNAGLVINATRFSRLSDFGGIKYSSNLQIRNTIEAYAACTGDCTAPLCAMITGLRVDSSYMGDGIKIIWSGTGNFTVKYKLQQAAGFDSGNISTMAGNEIILKNLDPCAAYFLAIQQKCVDGSYRTAGINFSSFYINISQKPINLRAELYDLEVKVERILDKNRDVYIKVDHQGDYIKLPAAQTSITINNLFADGARHRLDILLDTNNSVCKNIIYYKAPYYRADSRKILSADFNDCNFPTQWKDSVYIKAPTGYSDPNFTISNFSFNNVSQIPGSLDSTCMLFYDSQDKKIYNGVHSIVSTEINITSIRDPVLSFDYKFLSYCRKGTTYFKVTVFDGTDWQEIFRYENENDEAAAGKAYRNIWDTLPARVFIPLKKYSNSKLQLQFVLDDGSRLGQKKAYLFTAIDNILVDGYDSTGFNTTINYIIFPNPTSNIIFIKGLPVGQPFNFKITDVLGRTIKQGLLENYEIDVANFSSGFYFITLFQYGINKTITYKFARQ
jgi:hypothetical protein